MERIHERRRTNHFYKDEPGKLKNPFVHAKGLQKTGLINHTSTGYTIIVCIATLEEKGMNHNPFTYIANRINIERGKNTIWVSEVPKPSFNKRSVPLVEELVRWKSEPFFSYMENMFSDVVIRCINQYAKTLEEAIFLFTYCLEHENELRFFEGKSWDFNDSYSACLSWNENFMLKALNDWRTLQMCAALTVARFLGGIGDWIRHQNDTYQRERKNLEEALFF